MMVFLIEKFLVYSGSQIAHIACRYDIVAEIWQCLRLFLALVATFFSLVAILHLLREPGVATSLEQSY